MGKGIFQKMLDGELPLPRAAATLGAKIIEVDPSAGTSIIKFDGKEEFTNPVGNIQGGFLAAMLDDTMGPALTAMLDENEFAPTLELKINFIAPARVGLLTGFGHVISKGGTVCVLEGELKQNDKLIARASATALIRKIK
ncbi:MULTISPECIES: PaaI family thioesterase [unclassified Pseudovibrio]|uniref:PaaI family thioesterase n=1 Tax=unclassified Pseudovibrio TaxID=2627060 RepID=UPI0007AE91F3|nr:MULTISPECIES: PaaI family thioesterase [unclassified Pseudovibrio]KZL24749.1 Thioesterase superfamily protein [Pseudovibrio sp. WM33]KZL29036.1 Thioesterase superfamily protein [Pseudovibrio sp. Ad37]